jgi:hypothetical protein
MPDRQDKTWFEARDVTRARLSAGIWIPLYVSVSAEQKRFGQANHRSEFVGVRTFAVARKDRPDAESVDFSRAAQSHQHFAYGKKYYPTEAFISNDEKPIGVHLALVQGFDGAAPTVWSLNQDLVFALGLLREGDSWLCPAEGFEEVAQIRRSHAGAPTGLYIKPDYLKDYLAARKMALRIVQFLKRLSTMQTEDTFGWENERHSEERDGGIFTGSAWPIGGEAVMVVRVGRTDNWSADELPELSTPSDGNTISESHEFNRPDHGLYAIEGSFRRAEWLEPAERSPRVRHDFVPSKVTFIVDGAGSRQSADELDNEDIGKWLWFSPNVIPEILSRRGSNIDWYTFQTAGIELTPGYSVQFGLNKKGLVVTYARDVATLPEWQRIIWAGFNVPPDGGLPDELRQAQVGGEAANTQAPEEFFVKALTALDAAFQDRWGWPLRRSHAGAEEIASSVHRYRSLDEAGFLALAKDIARLTADSIDSAKLQTLFEIPKGQKLGSLKSLERVLATITAPEDAKKSMAVLAGIYELRLGDAHLPSEKLQDAFRLAGVSKDERPIFRAAHLIHNATLSVLNIARIVGTSRADHPQP